MSYRGHIFNEGIEEIVHDSARPNSIEIVAKKESIGVEFDEEDNTWNISITEDSKIGRALIELMGYNRFNSNQGE